jgi:hypothetical protein
MAVIFLKDISGCSLSLGLFESYSPAEVKAKKSREFPGEGFPRLRIHRVVDILAAKISEDIHVKAEGKF